jgi:pseudomonalisin/xanthomonalisin
LKGYNQVTPRGDPLKNRALATLTAATAAALIAAPTLLTGGTASAAPLVTHVGGLAPLHLKAAADLGAAPAAAAQDVTIVLALRDKAGLARLLKAQTTPGSAAYHQWLTPAQFAARFSPSQASVDAATSFARSQGLSVVSVSSNRTLVKVAGTTAAINEAFGVVERQVRAAGQTFLTPDRTATLPVTLRGVTASVLGLTTFNPNTLPHVTRAAAPYQTFGLATYGPRDFWQIYNAPAGTTGTGQKVAVITQGDLTQVAADLATFQQRNSLPAVPLQVVQVGPTSTDTSGQDEYDLDTQYSSGFAPGVSAVVAYNAATLGDVAPLNRWATDNTVKTASASYGGCEAINWLVGSVDADDQVFQQATSQGQSMFVSTGDEGSSCSILINTGTPVGVPDVEYPASSSWVVAVGGTSLTGQSTQPTREITWLGGGGGYSQFESAQPWQTDNLAFTGAVGRGLPDVSLDADSFSGYTVVVSGVDTTIGGTSASAPAWNGIWARVLQAHPSAGTAAPALYAASSAMVDITLGTNGLWAATPGYDLGTGLGSADITRLVNTVV